ADLVDVNRGHLQATFRHLPDTVRVPRDAVTWEVDWREAGLPEDQEYLRRFEATLSEEMQEETRHDDFRRSEMGLARGAGERIQGLVPLRAPASRADWRREAAN